MKPSLKKKWVAGLKSGNFQQGPGYLVNRDQFCCLGVLREVNDPDDDRSRNDDGLTLNDQQLEEFELTSEIQDAFTGLNDLSRIVINEEADNFAFECGPVPFEMIAGLIHYAL